MLAAIDPWILSFSAITVFVTIWMGFWSARKSKSASDFFVAGRSVSVGWNASAISGEYLSAASFMGVAGMVMAVGYDALWYPVCYACGYLFLLLFIAGPLRRFGAYTIPDFAEGRYDSPVFRKIAVIFVLCIGFFYTMPQMKGAGVTLAYIFPGLPYWVGVALVGAVITLNVALGGMKGITLVQAFQYWAKMFAISVPIFVLMSVYGHYGRQVEVNGTITAKFSGFDPVQIAFDGTNYSLTPKQKELFLKENEEFDRQIAAASTANQITNQEPLVLSEKKVTVVLAQRKSLPEKAPPDSTWLSPFGPLTTKAAKAAKPTVSFAGELVQRKHSLLDPSIQGKAQFVQSRFSLDSIVLEGGQFNADYVFLKHVQLRLLGEKFNPDTQAATRWSRDLETQAIPWTNRLSGSLPEVADALFAMLSTNGVTVLREGNTFTAFPTKDAVITPVDPKPYALLYTYSLIIALVCGTAGLPHILVRFYTNPDGVAAKRTTMWVMILIGIFYVFPPVFGVMGRNLLPALYEGIGAKGTDKIVLELPRLLNERIPHLGSILSGITCAGAFAAFMSTFSGLLVSMTGALAHDVYGRILRPQSSAADRMRMFKWCAVLVGGVAVLLGSFVEKLEINFMVGQAFAIAAASYFPLLFMSVWWRGMTMKGAAVGMLTGGLLSVGAISLTSFTTLAAGTDSTAEMFSMFKPLIAFWAAHPLLRILCEQPAIWAVPLAISLMVVVSKATRATVPADIRRKMLVLHAPEALGLKDEYIKEHEAPAAH